MHTLHHESLVITLEVFEIYTHKKAHHSFPIEDKDKKHLPQYLHRAYRPDISGDLLAWGKRFTFYFYKIYINFVKYYLFVLT